MSRRIFDRFRPIDTATRITEPPDLWTSRVSTRKGDDAVPHVEKVAGRDVWLIRDRVVGSPGFTTMAGFDGSPPDGPMGCGDIPARSFDARQRLACVRAYNDFLTDWCAPARERFIIDSGEFTRSDWTPERLALYGPGGINAQTSIGLFLENRRQIADLLFPGILPRYPKLQFVSVESGICLYGDVRERIDAGLSDAPTALRRKLLFDNAARLYQVGAPKD
ncbi:MAG: hypothetical protein R3F35_05695 [Myxococcota bacterium]